MFQSLRSHGLSGEIETSTGNALKRETGSPATGKPVWRAFFVSECPAAGAHFVKTSGAPCHVFDHNIRLFSADIAGSGRAFFFHVCLNHRSSRTRFAIALRVVHSRETSQMLTSIETNNQK